MADIFKVVVECDRKDGVTVSYSGEGAEKLPAEIERIKAAIPAALAFCRAAYPAIFSVIEKVAGAASVTTDENSVTVNIPEAPLTEAGQTLCGLGEMVPEGF